jgi:hypothetical protein
MSNGLYRTYHGHSILSQHTADKEPLPAGHDGWDHVVTTEAGEVVGTFTNLGVAIEAARLRNEQERAAAPGVVSGTTETLLESAPPQGGDP